MKLTRVKPAGMVSSIAYPLLAGRFALGIIVTTIVAPAETVAADKDLVTFPTLGAAIALAANVISISNKEIGKIYFVVFMAI